MMLNSFYNLFAALAPANCSKNFLGLETWFHYLPASDFDSSSCDITHFSLFQSGSNPSDIPLILVAVVDDLLRIAGLIALGFIFVAAIKFITSEGNPESAANARSTLINALAGLAISIVAVVFINFLGTSIGT
jgi:hypothetical protein